jgi:uncharacterized protein (TIGR03083 family)
MPKQPSPWPTIHAERHALVRDLQSLTDEQWATPSLCPGWSVHDVLGHMTATAAMTPGSFFARLIKSGLRYSAATDKAMTEELQGSPAETLTRFESLADASTHPPGPVESWLGETIVHSEDIRRPLGIDHEYPVDAVTRAAGFYRNSNLLIGGKRRAKGLLLRATDTEWSRGSGPEVAGPARSLLLAITGRAVGLDDLSGEGVEELRSRM